MIMGKDSALTLHLSQQLEALSCELAEARQTIETIREGGVDALVVKGSAGDQVYTLISTDHLYRTLLEEMNEGALSVTSDGLILFANRRFAKMVGAPLAQVIGSRIQKWMSPADQKIFDTLLQSDTEKNMAKN